MRKLIALFTILSFSGLCFAPINLEEKPSNWQIRPEANEQQLREAQSRQKVVGEVGVVMQRAPERSPELNSADPGAKAMLGQAEQTLSQEGAKETLVAAEQNRQSGGGSTFWFWGVAFGALGFGVVYGLRMWANKAIPEPVVKGRKVTW